jgi:hypothetical protein
VSEVEQVKKVANGRGVDWGIVADRSVVRRVWQVIAAAAGDRRQAPVVFDELQNRNMVRIVVGNVARIGPDGDGAHHGEDARYPSRRPTSDADPNDLSTGNQEERSRSEIGAFPVDALPPLLRELCRGLADLHGVPVQFPAALAIAAIGGAAGKGLQVDT